PALNRIAGRAGAPRAPHPAGDEAVEHPLEPFDLFPDQAFGPVGMLEIVKGDFGRDLHQAFSILSSQPNVRVEPIVSPDTSDAKKPAGETSPAGGMLFANLRARYCACACSVARSSVMLRIVTRRFSPLAASVFTFR